MKYSKCPVMLLLYVCVHALTKFVNAASAHVCSSIDAGSQVMLESGTGKAKLITGMVYYVPIDNGSTDVHGAVAWGKDRDPASLGGSPSVNVLLQIKDPGNALLYSNDTGMTVGKIEIQTTPKKTLMSPSESILRDLAGEGLNDTVLASSQSDQVVRLDECFRLWYKNQKRPIAVYQIPIEFQVKGTLLGKTGVQIGVRTESSDWSWLWVSLVVLRDRHKVVLNHIFIGVLTILIIIANVLMGCKLQLQVVRSVIRKPLAPVIGLLSQFLFMPLFSFMLAMFMFDTRNVLSLGLGLFTTGCSPGGGASNFYTVLLDGNVDLSVTMTFVSTVAAAGLMPAWLFSLGHRFMNVSGAEKIRIPYKNIGISLSVLVLPLLLGIAIRRFLPKVADGLLKGLRPFLLLIITFICTFGIYANLYMFKLMTWRVLVSGLALPLAGFLFGAGFAGLCNQPRDNVVAIAIETGIQNSGIAIMLLKLSFPAPDGDMSSVIPVVVSMFTPGPLMLAYLVHSIRKCRQREPEDAMDEDDDLEGGTAKPVNGDEAKKAPWYYKPVEWALDTKLGCWIMGKPPIGRRQLATVELKPDDRKELAFQNGYLLCAGVETEVKGATTGGSVGTVSSHGDINPYSTSACPLVPGVDYNM